MIKKIISKNVRLVRYIFNISYSRLADHRPHCDVVILKLEQFNEDQLVSNNIFHTCTQLSIFVLKALTRRFVSTVLVILLFVHHMSLTESRRDSGRGHTCHTCHGLRRYTLSHGLRRGTLSIMDSGSGTQPVIDSS